MTKRTLCCDLRVMGTTPSNNLPPPRIFVGLFLGKTRDRGQAGGPGQPGAMVVSIGRGSPLYILGVGMGQKDSYLLGMCPGVELAMKGSKGLGAMVICVQQNSPWQQGQRLLRVQLQAPAGSWEAVVLTHK